MLAGILLKMNMKDLTKKEARELEKKMNKMFDLVLGNENKEYVCPICGKKFTGYGNNPRPVKNEGRCCDNCNRNAVIPARIHCMRLGVGW